MSQPSPERPRVLIAEDYEDTRLMLAAIFRAHGALFDFDFAETGPEALDAWRTRRYALLLLDIGLPEKSGLRVAEEIRAAGDEQTPIKFFTNADLAPMEYMRAKLANGEIIENKSSIDPAAFVATVERGLGLRRLKGL